MIMYSMLNSLHQLMTNWPIVSSFLYNNLELDLHCLHNEKLINDWLITHGTCLSEVKTGQKSRHLLLYTPWWKFWRDYHIHLREPCDFLALTS